MINATEAKTNVATFINDTKQKAIDKAQAYADNVLSSMIEDASTRGKSEITIEWKDEYCCIYNLQEILKTNNYNVKTWGPTRKMVTISWF